MGRKKLGGKSLRKHCQKSTNLGAEQDRLEMPPVCCPVEGEETSLWDLFWEEVMATYLPSSSSNLHPEPNSTGIHRPPTQPLSHQGQPEKGRVPFPHMHAPPFLARALIYCGAG